MSFSLLMKEIGMFEEIRRQVINQQRTKIPKTYLLSQLGLESEAFILLKSIISSSHIIHRVTVHFEIPWVFILNQLSIFLILQLIMYALSLFIPGI